MSFRLWTIFYVFALFAAAMATFGGWGIPLAVAIILFWTWALSVPKMPPLGCLLELSVVLFIIFSLLALLLPAVGSARPRPYTSVCRNNLRQLVAALLSYESHAQAFPPAYTLSAAGEPTFSWRTLLLPQLDRADIYERLDFSKSWDDAANISSITWIEVFECPAQTQQISGTDYFAVIGPHTAWPVERGRQRSEFTDPRSDTIVLVECGGRTTGWAEPRDLSFNEAVDLLSQPMTTGDGHRVDRGFFYKPCYVRSIAFADGHVEQLYAPLSRKTAAAALTVDGRESFDHAEFERALQPEFDYGRCYGLAVFIVLTLLPLRKLVRRNEHTSADEKISVPTETD